MRQASAGGLCLELDMVHHMSLGRGKTSVVRFVELYGKYGWEDDVQVGNVKLLLFNLWCWESTLLGVADPCLDCRTDTTGRAVFLFDTILISSVMCKGILAACGEASQ